jgi:CheY-like chemotaxis protein
LARKILLADDSVTAQNMGRKILVDAGYDVLTVNNGSAALKRITETKPDLIILDVYMPGYSGLEVCQRLKDSPETANIPVLLSVGKLEPFKPQEARRVRANAHIVKPFEASELLSAIARLEDCIVPQAHKPSFCSPLPTEAEADERFASAESNPDFARKSASRAGLKRKERSEREPEEPVANFRDFRKVKASPVASPTMADSTESQETVAVPELPSNITTEELDALSAVAAKLDETVASPENTVSPVETATPVETAQAVQSSGSQWDAPATSGADKTDEAAAAPIGEIDAAKAVAADLAIGPSVLSAIETAANEVAVPVEKIEVAVTEVTAAGKSQDDSSLVAVQPVERALTTELGTAEPQPSDSQSTEVQAVSGGVPEAATQPELVAQPAAPIDQQEEPMFASAALLEERTELSVQPEQHSFEAAAQETKTEEVAQGSANPIEAVSETADVAEKHEEELSPSDEELAEALRLLTPSTANATVSLALDHADTSDQAASFVAQESNTNREHVASEHASGDASNGSRWMAEAIGLTPEEAAISLEAEMFLTFATAPAGEVHTASEISGASLITAAVESRLAERTESVSEAVPKAMAAVAAATESGTPHANSSQKSEDNAIANIVEQVLADLRPKIVEEIAKKLGKSH